MPLAAGRSPFLLVAGLLWLCGCAAGAPPTDPAAFPPPPPGTGRIWVYRIYEPAESLGQPYVRLNGAVTAISQPGGAFYRNLAPGQYRITVDSFGVDVGQFAEVALAPGQTVFVKIESAKSWESDLTYGRDTFYTRCIPPADAIGEIRQSRFSGGG